MAQAHALVAGDFHDMITRCALYGIKPDKIIFGRPSYNMSEAETATFVESRDSHFCRKQTPGTWRNRIIRDQSHPQRIADEILAMVLERLACSRWDGESSSIPVRGPASATQGLGADSFSQSPNNTVRISGTQGQAATQAVQEAHPDPKFFLLCITVEGFVVLEELDVRDIENGQYLFERIRDYYKCVHTRGQWFQKHAATGLLYFQATGLARLLGTMDLKIASRVHFVRFSLELVGIAVQPYHFRCPSSPPKNEIKVKKSYQ